MAIEIKMYQCEHCRKTLRKTKKGINNHESKCFYNTKTKSCATCVNLSNAICATSIDEKRNKRRCMKDINIIKSLKTNCDCWSLDDSSFDEDFI